MRTFLAFEIDEDSKNKIWRLKKDLCDIEPIRFERKEKLHITAEFFGELDRNAVTSVIKAMETLKGRYGKTELSLDQIGCFPHPSRPRVLWIGSRKNQEKLKKIREDFLNTWYNETIQAKVQKEPENYVPHITLARIKKPIAKEKTDQMLALSFAPITAKIERLSLFESVLKPTGAEYTKLYSVLL